MANLGNTGQRYKMSKFAKVEQENGSLRISLECGHTYLITSSHEWTSNYYRNLIEKGKRTRCLECQKG